MTAGPKSVKGGVDDGTAWRSLGIPPNASPETVAHLFLDSFNGPWIDRFIKVLVAMRKQHTDDQD